MIGGRQVWLVQVDTAFAPKAARLCPFGAALISAKPAQSSQLLRCSENLRIKHIEAINGWLKAHPSAVRRSPTSDSQTG